MRRFWATNAHGPMNWMCNTDRFSSRARERFRGGKYAATSCGRIGMNGASIGDERKRSFWGFGQAERAASRREARIGGANSRTARRSASEALGGGGACIARVHRQIPNPKARNRFWRLVTSPRQRLRADTGELSLNDLHPSLQPAFIKLVRWSYILRGSCSLKSRGFLRRGSLSFPARCPQNDGLRTGTKLAMFHDGESIYLKPIPAPDLSGFRKLASEAKKTALNAKKKGAKK